MKKLTTEIILRCIPYLSAFHCFPDLGILAVTEAQDELVYVKLRKLKGLTGHGLDNITSPCLEYIDIRDCTHVAFEGIYQRIYKTLLYKIKKCVYKTPYRNSGAVVNKVAL